MTYPPPAGPDPYGQPSDPFGQPAPNPYEQQPVYGQQYPQAPYLPYAPTAPVGGNNGMAIGAMVTGIVSLLLSCCCGVFSLPFSVAAIVLGVISRKQIAERGQTNGAMALAGIITGAVATVLALILFILSLAGTFNSYIYDLNSWS